MPARALGDGLVGPLVARGELEGVVDRLAEVGRDALPHAGVEVGREDLHRPGDLLVVNLGRRRLLGHLPLSAPEARVD